MSEDKFKDISDDELVEEFWTRDLEQNDEVLERLEIAPQEPELDWFSDSEIRDYVTRNDICLIDHPEAKDIENALWFLQQNRPQDALALIERVYKKMDL